MEERSLLSNVAQKGGVGMLGDEQSRKKQDGRKKNTAGHTELSLERRSSKHTSSEKVNATTALVPKKRKKEFFLKFVKILHAEECRDRVRVV